MDLIYTNPDKEDVGVLHDYDFDLAFGADENNFECKVDAAAHCCQPGAFLYIEGTEYGGIIDSIEVNTEEKTVIYKGRTWHGILANRIIEPPVTIEESKSLLPEGYTRLAYIESNGTQYINTAFTPNSNSRVVADVQFANVAASMHVFGARTAATNKAFTCSVYYSITNAFQSEYGTSAVRPVSEWNKRHIIDKNKNVFSMDGVETTQPAQSFSCEYPLFVFTTNNGGNTHAEMASMRLYSMQVYDNDSLVRDFIPCRNPDGAAGLYDTANGVFYGNAGTGVFYGGELAELPDGFVQLDYIEATGTQYIDTKCVLNQNSRVELDIQVTDTATRHLFGARTAGTTNSFFIPFITASSIRVDYASQQKTFSLSSPLNRTFIDFNKNLATINGVTQTFTAATFSTVVNATIFASNTNGTIVADTYKAKMKLFSCRIYDDGAIIRSFVPCRNASGDVGLYDTVNGVFYGDAAGNGFFGGFAVNRKLPSGYTQVEYIESSGTQYIDTGFKANQDTRVVMDAQLTSFVEASQFFFGGRTSATSKAFAVSWYKESTTYYAFYYNAGSSFTTNADPLKRHTIDSNKNKLTANGVSVSRTYANFQCDYSVFLCAVNTVGSASQYARLKLYGCQIYDNGTLVRDYVPCIDALGTAGLYDLVNGVFYTDAAGGTFAVGAVIDTPENEGTTKTVITRYDNYVVSGNANHILDELISYLGLSDVFTADANDSPVVIGKYDFRFVDAYKGIRDMLAAYGGKLRFTFKVNTVVLSAIFFRDFSQNEEFDSSQVDFEVQRNYRYLNHLICLGSGNMKDRHVIHLFTDEHGGVMPYVKNEPPLSDEDYILDTSQQRVFGMDEISEVYDYANAQTVENYVALDRQPNDWSDNYAAYFTLNEENQYVSVEGIPVKVYALTTEQPEKWTSMYANYFVKLGSTFLAVEGVSGLTYELQRAAPSDWQKNFANYYVRKDGKYSSVASEGYLEYYPISTKPEGFESEITQYYKLQDNGGFVPAVEGDVWEENRYAIAYPRKKAPKWEKDTYYTGHPAITAPAWTSGMYYSLEDAKAKPPFAPGAYFEKRYDHYAELVAGGLERIKSAFGNDSIKIDLDLDGEYDVGDIVGASEHITGISVWQPITKKIVNIKNGLTTISYKVGD